MMCAVHRQRRAAPSATRLSEKGSAPSQMNGDFTWSTELAHAHTFYTHGRTYACRAPVQGSALMPLVAQTTSAVLAEAPSTRAGPWEWVSSGTSIIYDNILIAGNEDDVKERWSRLLARCAEAKVVIGDTQPPCHTLVSCGLEYDVADPHNQRVPNGLVLIGVVHFLEP